MAPVGMRDKRGHSFISHIHTHTHLPPRPFIFTLTGFSCSVSLTEDGGERDGGRMSGKGGWVKKKGVERKGQFELPAKSSTNQPTTRTPSPPCVTGCTSSLCLCALPFFPFHLFPPSISLIVSFSSHPLVASPRLTPLLPSPPRPSSLSLSSSVHPSLSLGLASVGRFQSVCSLMTPLGADVMLSSCCFALQHHPSTLHPITPSSSISLSLPPFSYVLIYLHVFLFPPLRRYSTIN